MKYLRGNVIKSCGLNKICCQFKLPTAGNIEEYDYGGIFSVKKCGRKGTSENLRTRISNEFEKDESEVILPN